MKKGISVLLAVLLSIVILPGKKGVSMQNPLDFLILNRSIIEDSSSISRIEKDTFLFPLKQLNVDSTKGNLSFSFPNCSVSTVPEAPDFPVYKKTYSMELCESVSYINTVSVEGICLGYSNSRIATVPEPKRYGIEDEVGVGVYRTSVNVSEFSSTYPAVNVQSKVSSIDNKKTLSLVIHPLHIHEGALYLLTHIEIEIGFGTGFQPLSIPNNKKNSSIILAPDEFKGAANALAEIQKGNGYDVDVVLLSEIEKLEPAAFPKIVASGYSKEKADSGEYAGFLKDYDYILSAKIRTLLETRLKNDRVDYLTIIGDAFWVPPSFYYFGNDYRIKKWAERYVPTDFHYMAPFASEWDVNFSISVGRIPVHNAVHASLYIDKIRDYYSSLELHEPWTNTVSLFSGDPFRGDYYSELIQIDSINKDVLNGLNIYKYFQTDGLFLEEQCKKVMFSGNNRLLWLSGHGSGTEFYTADGCIGVQDLLEATTNKQLPIIISESCLNGMWDSQLINGQEKVPPVSFSESLFQSKAAGIAYIGGARTNYSYGEVRYNKSVPAIEKVTYMDATIQYTNENMNCSNSTLGDAVKKSLETYYRNDILSQEYLKQIYTPDVNTLFGYCLLGDPTLPTISSESKPSYSTPAIHSIEEYDPTGRNVPVFSVDNGQTIQISSDSPTLRYVYSSYDNKENGLYFSDIMEPSGENRYQKHFVHFVKAKGCLRFETADKKETRSVFEAKHDIDVGVEIETPSLSIVHQNEFVTCAFRVRNDGIYDTGPIEVVTSVKGNAIGFFPIENIPPLTSVLHNYTFHPTECTNETVRVSANVLNGDDTFPDNDMCNKQYRVPEGKIFRVGVLTTSGNSSLYFRDSVTNNTLDLDKLNTLFWDDNINIEIQTVSNYVNKNGNVSYDILGFCQCRFLRQGQTGLLWPHPPWQGSQ